MAPPRNPPTICAAMYIGTFDHANVPIEASAIVTAGVRCAPLTLLTQYTATVTANAHPAVMTIHPELWPLGAVQDDVGDDAIAKHDEDRGAEKLAEDGRDEVWAAETRSEIGHWEMDVVIGAGNGSEAPTKTQTG